MTLDELKKDWESLAERDALGAILTDASKTRGRWDVAEFMSTGEAEIQVVMGHLARLTQPLARRFASCVGVDISPQMIQKAESLNQYAHCRYVASSDARLPFADASFSFLYSNIVLQHMPPRFSEQYLREFVRVLAPEGVLVFGVQDSFAAPDISSRMVRVRHVLRIRSRIKDALGWGQRNMQMHCLPEPIVRRALDPAKVVDIQLTNTAAKDFNGKLVYLRQPPTSGYMGKQYCAVKQP